MKKDHHNEKIESVVLGGGCFWCIEAAFSQIKGVIEIVSGYAGGHKEDPSYEEVSSGRSGHAETVKITFDKNQISYEEILLIFFDIHDPTTPNRQGNDIGPQYRSIILYANNEQKRMVQDLVSKMTREKVYEGPIVTQIAPLENFYPAEEYHQRYFEKNPGQAYCQMVIKPKLSKLKKVFKNFHK